MEIVTKSEGQVDAEAEVDGFRQDLGPFVVAAETTRMAMVFTNAKASGNPIVFANDAFLNLTGYDRDHVLGQMFDRLLVSSDGGDAAARLHAAFVNEIDGSVEVECRRADGGTFSAAIYISPVRSGAGDVVEHFASFVDLTKHRRAEEHLRFLLDELNHRTQNTLATVQAIAVQTLRGAASKEVVDAFEGRVIALSKAHSLLGREDWAAVDLRALLDQILRPFGLHDPKVTRFHVEGPEIHLPPKSALTLAMVLHELATNASKYGALSNDANGQIKIGWVIESAPPDARMQLRWQEIGGPKVTPPSRRGFGSRLIQSGLAQEVDGEVRLDFAPSGVVCEIVMPVPAEDRS